MSIRVNSRAAAHQSRNARPGWRVFVFALTLATLVGALFAQAGRRSHPTNDASTTLNVVAVRSNGAATPITAKDISLFDNGAQQTIKNFSPDLSPARIVLLVDNSLTIRADVEKLENATQEFAYEIYDGDKLLIVGYDNAAEIVSFLASTIGNLPTISSIVATSVGVRA